MYLPPFSRRYKELCISIEYSLTMDIDIGIFDDNNQLSVQFEIKNKKGTSANWAGKFLRNLIAHNNIIKSDFFILISPEHTFFWKNFQIKSDIIEPNYEVDSTQLFKQYFKLKTNDEKNISEGRMETIISKWLSDIRLNKIDLNELEQSNKWLFESGLIEVIKKGHVHYQLTTEETVFIR